VTGIVRHPRGPRLYVAGLRVHHGSAGLAVAAAAVALRRPSVAAAALVAVAHDRADFPWRDCDNH
jgi:hypothetical protein